MQQSLHSTESLVEALRALQGLRLLVLGDAILDHYVRGEVHRISPEAPIPVLLQRSDEYKLGGASCVAANVVALGCQSLMFGAIGQDQEGDTFCVVLEEQGIDGSHILRCANLQTIVKTRFLSTQHLLRVDRESPWSMYKEHEQQVIQALHQQIPGCHAVIISDYLKGFLTPNILSATITASRAAGIPVVCDPGKGRNLADYTGVTTLKPNRLEAEAILGASIRTHEDMIAAASTIRQRAKADFVSLSLDKDGIFLFFDEERHRLYPTQSLEVFDVTGAGDTVITLIGALLGAGQTPDIAVILANIAAGLQVSYSGVVHLSAAQIQRASQPRV